VAEGARLESVYTGNRIVGSNPTPSATATAIVTRCASLAEYGSTPRHLHDVKQPAAWPDTQPVSFPRRIFCARVVVSCFFVSNASPLPWPALRRGSRPILGVSCSSDPEMRGRRSAGRRTTLIRRASKTRPHACEACPSRATGTSASRRSTVALPRPRCVSGISAGAGARLARRPSFMAGYGPRVRSRLRAAADATPRSAVRIVSGDAPHERGWRIYITSSHRSQ
jgi:hypothetical protein